MRGVEAGLQGETDLHVTQGVPWGHMEDRWDPAAAQESTVETWCYRGERSGVFHMIEKDESQKSFWREKIRRATL